MLSAKTRARLAALVENNAAPYHIGRGFAMHVGMPKIKLRAVNGEYTEAGELWHELRGTDPVRYNGQLHRTANTQYMLEDGTKHVSKKLVQGPNGPEWRATRKGLRFREHNEWEVLIPAIGHH